MKNLHIINPKKIPQLSDEQIAGIMFHNADKYKIQNDQLSYRVGQIWDICYLEHIQDGDIAEWELNPFIVDEISIEYE